MSQSKVVSKNPLQDLPDQWIFFTLAFIGALSILFLKTIGLPQVIVTLFPVLLIFGYASLAFFPGRFRLREDKIGDNCYYLGFVYTLVSLGYALYVYSPTGAGVETIIANFGIALATTIVGLILRVFFNQMRMDPDEYEADARRALSDSAMKLRTELNSIAVQMADFKRSIVQIVEEGLTEVQKKSQETLESNVGAFNKATLEVIGAVDQTLKSYEGTSKRMGEVAELTVSAVEQLAKRVEAVNVSPEMVSAKLDPIIVQLGQIVNEVATRESGNTKALQALKKALENAVASAQALDAALEKGAAGAQVGAERLLLGSTKTIQSADETLAATKRVLADLGAAIASFRAEVGTASLAIAEDGRKFVENTRAQQAAASEHVTALRTLASEGRGAVDEVQKNLISLTRTVVEQVRA